MYAFRSRVLWCCFMITFVNLSEAAFLCYKSVSQFWSLQNVLLYVTFTMLCDHRHQGLLTSQMNLFILSPVFIFYTEKMNTFSKMNNTVSKNIFKSFDNVFYKNNHFKNVLQFFLCLLRNDAIYSYFLLCCI